MRRNLHSRVGSATLHGYPPHLLLISSYKGSMPTCPWDGLRSKRLELIKCSMYMSPNERAFQQATGSSDLQSSSRSMTIITHPTGRGSVGLQDAKRGNLRMSWPYPA